ncbi:MAG: LysR family transcriptional regulator [Myxococcota bacterium]
MERVRRLHELWSWLPAFRVVAETQHLPSASQALHVTPSALSRSIRLLEDAAGTPLFDRTGRRIVLNAAGEAFLRAVRDAMRTVHEGLQAVEASQFLGPVHVAAAGALATPLVLPALGRVTSDHPRLVPHLHDVVEREMAGLLRRGVIDVALAPTLPEDDALTVSPLLELSYDVFAAPEHPLTTKTGEARIEGLAEAPFAALFGSEGEHDRWPIHRRRRIAMRVAREAELVNATASGGFVAVLPVAVGRRAGLVGLGAGLPSERLFVAHRPSITLPGRTEAVVDALRERARELAADDDAVRLAAA